MKGSPVPKHSTPLERDAVHYALECKGKWRSLPKLAARSGLSERRVQVALHDMVVDGIPIVTGPAGARIAASIEEIVDAAGRLKHRSASIAIRADALLATAKRMQERDDRQVPLFPLDEAGAGAR